MYKLGRPFVDESQFGIVGFYYVHLHDGGELREDQGSPVQELREVVDEEVRLRF